MSAFAISAAFADKAMDREIAKAFAEIDTDIIAAQAKKGAEDAEAGIGTFNEVKFAVLNIDTPDAKFSQGLTIDMETAITKNKYYSVIERTKINMIRSEKHEQNESGEVSDNEMARIGAEAGANVIITGSVFKVGAQYKFNIRAVDVETARVLTSYTHNFKKKDDADLYIIFGDKEADELAVAQSKTLKADAKAKSKATTNAKTKTRTRESHARQTYLLVGGHVLGAWLFGLNPGATPGFGEESHAFNAPLAWGGGGYVGLYNSPSKSGFQLNIDFTGSNINTQLVGINGHDKSYKYSTMELAALYRVGTSGASFLIGPYASMPLSKLSLADSGNKQEAETEYDFVNTMGMFSSFGVEAGINIGIRIGPGHLTLNGTYIFDFTKLKIIDAGKEKSLFNRTGLLFGVGYELLF
jgi:TolB-like protein